MTTDGSITNHLKHLRQGDQCAAQELWNRYLPRLLQLADRRLGSLRSASDEEDVVQSAFRSFFAGVQRGRFPQLNDRDNLWRLLFTITWRKTVDHHKRERAQRRGGGKVRNEANLFGTSSSDEARGLDYFVGSEPTAERAAEVAEGYRQLLEVLKNETLQNVAVWKMEGWTNEEIANKLDCVPRTVERKLSSIRAIWSLHDDS